MDRAEAEKKPAKDEAGQYRATKEKGGKRVENKKRTEERGGNAPGGGGEERKA